MLRLLGRLTLGLFPMALCLAPRGDNVENTMEVGSVVLVLEVAHLDFTFSTEGRTQSLEDVRQVLSP